MLISKTENEPPRPIRWIGKIRAKQNRQYERTHTSVRQHAGHVHQVRGSNVLSVSRQWRPGGAIHSVFSGCWLAFCQASICGERLSKPVDCHKQWLSTAPQMHGM
jgi:hypothetical protein